MLLRVIFLYLLFLGISHSENVSWGPVSNNTQLGLSLSESGNSTHLNWFLKNNSNNAFHLYTNFYISRITYTNISSTGNSQFIEKGTISNIVNLPKSDLDYSQDYTINDLMYVRLPNNSITKQRIPVKTLFKNNGTYTFSMLLKFYKPKPYQINPNFGKDQFLWSGNLISGNVLVTKE